MEITKEAIEAKSKLHREQQKAFAEQAAAHEQEMIRCRQMTIVHQGAAESLENLLKEAAGPASADPQRTE